MRVDPAIGGGPSHFRQEFCPRACRGALNEYGSADPEAFVRRAYEVFLGRPADEGGLAFYAREIAGGISRSNTIDCLLSSAELESKLRVDVPGTPLR